jgi:virginiamycin B lyase
VKEYLSPSGARSAPHGLTTAGNIVWYVESKSLPNTLVRFDPATERFQTFAIPAGYVIVRDIAVTEDGNLAFAMDQVDRIALATIGR